MLAAAITIVGAALMTGTAQATTMNVNTVVDGYIDDGKCGLREAVEATRKNLREDGCPKGSTARDTIVLRDRTYLLTVPTSNESNNVNGDLDLSGGGSLTIRGQGPGKTEVRSEEADRVFDLESLASDLTLERLKFGNGDVTPYGGTRRRGNDERNHGRGRLRRGRQVRPSRGRGGSAPQPDKGRLPEGPGDLKEAAYNLSLGSTNESNNANGDLDLTGGGPVTVLGKGSGDTAIVESTDEDRIYAKEPRPEGHLQGAHGQRGPAGVRSPEGQEVRGGRVLGVATHDVVPVRRAELRAVGGRGSHVVG
ncbi:MAG: hypothetical protein ACR2G3_04225 [Solirubrobacterales bacterium]